jgi:hypothetical protein
MATCKDCLHYEACKRFNEIRTNVIDESKRGAENLCELYADKSRFVELPCKVGDTVWYLNPVHEICEALVESVEFNLYTNPQTWISVKYYSEWFGEHRLKSRIDMLLNKTVFLTREEAEAALAERRNE